MLRSPPNSERASRARPPTTADVMEPTVAIAPTPSARLSTIATRDTELATRIAQGRKEATANLSRLLKSELEWIPLKALRKERGERYPSPADLARDIQNYLSGRPLVAAPESSGYRVRKYVRRHRGAVAAVAAIFAALVFGLGLATWQWRVAEPVLKDPQTIYKK